MSDEAMRRARKGAAWLDKNLYSNWRERVDPDDLNMASPFGCILGQVAGDYWAAKNNYIHLIPPPYTDNDDSYDVWYEWAREHGFMSDEGEEMVPTDPTFRQLDQAWRSILGES